jgi:hypothetical protein
MSPWIESCKPTPEPSCGTVLPHEQFPYSLHNTSAGYVDAFVPRRAGKEIVFEYSSDSNAVPGYNSKFSYEFDFGLDPF